MRYTAATCDPDEFAKNNGYTLRANLYSRNTELLIAITSYNENKALYARTLHAVMLNIRNLCKTQLSGYWRRSATAARGIASWENITVVLLIDGHESMDRAVLDLLAAVGVYQPNVMRGQDTVAHIFEVCRSPQGPENLDADSLLVVYDPAINRSGHYALAVCGTQRRPKGSSARADDSRHQREESKEDQFAPVAIQRNR